MSLQLFNCDKEADQRREWVEAEADGGIDERLCENL
jgi:hypothetical protein